METSIGHVLPGLGFFLVGLWHMLNQMKLHFSQPKSHLCIQWFPSPRIRYIELFLIILGSLAFLSEEIFIGLQRRTLFDPDGTIPFSKLRKFEHANIAITIFMYAALSIILDKVNPPAKYGMTQLLGAVIFGQQLLNFHFHSTDHMGVEGQYHFLLQVFILVSFATTILGIPFPHSFMNGFVMSFSIMLQGFWLILMGVMLWTPQYIPKGCFLNEDDDQYRHHVVMRCHDDEATKRAISLVNIQFGWCVIGFTVFVTLLYLVLFKCYSYRVPYNLLPTKFEDRKDELVLQDAT
ncbi:unnamed protein product [Cuscuta epithymum]|uniref:Transmembrane protein 45A-like n=1 Tax=Cuscuta epithymum TaxID=186058 RepID=A0AAV0CTM9_9ASTE|nr:unnamed protein product [Cuscuta epithymum]